MYICLLKQQTFSVLDLPRTYIGILINLKLKIEKKKNSSKNTFTSKKLQLSFFSDAGHNSVGLPSYGEKF